MTPLIKFTLSTIKMMKVHIQSARRAFREIPQNQVATLAIIELAEDPIDAENKKIPNVTVSNSNTEDTATSKEHEQSLKMTTINTINMQPQDEKILARPIEHIVLAGPEDRNIFKQIIISFNTWVKCPPDALKICVDVGNRIQDIFLVLDDIEDGTTLRRGFPAAHLVYGIPVTVHAAVYNTFRLMQKLFSYAENREDTVLDDFIMLGIRFFTGQGLEIRHRDIHQCPTFDDYAVLVRAKNTDAIIWGVRCLKLCAKNEEIEFGTDLYDKIGQFVQIYGDYINLHNPKYAAVRVFCDDLDEGKFSFPIIHAIQSYPNDHRLLDMLKKRPLDMESKKLFVDIMEGFGSFEYTRKVMEELKNGILADVDKMNLRKNSCLERLLQDVFDNLETEIYYDGCD
ncbi:geranylgeranyl pyrophosphate synthase-like [Zophobas morio]|uniref:geranylgeranyl pyrophosphate synthase-like n=1 Tax=Zophobas morio TaxID=2755281 RepID=UPI003082FBE3